ncbi:hypothetical protein MBLNU457_g0806t1 [Dothideomycetes sp. NU457]
MSDRRPLSSYASGNYDLPAATSSLSQDVQSVTRLDRLRRTLERHRDESRREAEYLRGAAPNQRRRRLRPVGNHLATFEDRNDQYRFHSSESSEAEEDTRPRHAKRRKLTHQNVPADTKSYKYGYYGQVEPGRLKMDIYSCDGGVHFERGLIYYGEHNILKHDQSVYCSKSPKCNIILRHHDRTDFCLEKLYIIAPNIGFTAPVKEGTVTVGMNIEELIAMTDLSVPAVQARPRDPALENVNAERLSLLESMRDTNRLTRRMERHQARGWYNDSRAEELRAEDNRVFDRLRNTGTSSRATETRQDQGFYDDPRDNYAAGNWRIPGEEEEEGGLSEEGEAEWPPLQPTPRPQQNTRSRQEEESQAAAILESGLMVTMLHGDEIEWKEDQTSPAVMADRMQRVQSAYLEDEDYEDGQGMDPREDSPEVVPETGNGLKGLTTVRFRIKSGKSKLTIKFDPPVSGSCILLQLQGPPGGPNIDIQTVLASGYAGPRFFPAQQCV